MLIEFFGRNFGCFRDEFRLSMVPADIDPGSCRGIVEVKVANSGTIRLLRSAAIYGPNASGKSTILRAAHALRYLLAASGAFESDELIGPYEPFALEKQTRRKPIMLGLRAIVDQHVYEYQVEFDRKRFLFEKLSELEPDGTATLFERQAQTVTGPWTKHKQFHLLSESFRTNALLLSLADRLSPDLAHGLSVGFRQLLNSYDASASMAPFFGGVGETAAWRAHRDQQFAAWMRPWLRSADLGIVDFEVQEVAMPPLDDEGVDSARKHSQTNRDYMLVFLHGGASKANTIPYARESMGTRRLVGIAPFIHDLLHGKKSQAYFIDEIGASLHPQLLEGIVHHFNCEADPRSVQGQLIFATHDTALIEGEAREATLRRDQVWFTEKDPSGASRLYSLAEFKERQNLNLRLRYLQGRYGALPAIGSFSE